MFNKKVIEMLKKAQGNMYEFLNDHPQKGSDRGYTWNPISGRCEHNCKYCYMKMFPLGNLNLNRKKLKTDLGKNNFIFIGSSCDMFANDVPKEWIFEVLAHCVKSHNNKYLFQSKNPNKMFLLRQYIPEYSVIGTTLETNRSYPEMGKAPSITERVASMHQIKNCWRFKEIMLTIEPIMDFDLEEFVRLIKTCKPTWVNIGADSKNHNLPEPSKEKIQALIEELKKFTEIKFKSNLDRIMKK